MKDDSDLSWFRKIKNAVIGGPRNINDPGLFHKLALVAFFAWVGFGADGISSSCYGPEEAFLALQNHTFLGIFVALASAVTVLVISASYMQIIELFPTGGGGYLVASKLLSPFWGMVSGCALLIDYVLTITISVASGADALFSFLPPTLYSYKIYFAFGGVLFLMLMNMRGAKESVLPLVPIFLTFILTHAFAIIYIVVSHLADFGALSARTATDIQTTSSQLGFLGMILLILRAYSMGAGTFTGIEAVSNGIPFLREPRVQTAKRTMKYMAASLSFIVVGLMIGYITYRVKFQTGKTLNAVLFETMTSGWQTPYGHLFVLVTLISEAVLLFVAAQTGFFGGPRVLANMSMDRWFPQQFSMLSERFVIQNGILIMGGASILVMLLTGGSVKFLVVLYSINVFITFLLAQLGMVLYWWRKRSLEKKWKRRITVNGIGLCLTVFLLASIVALKFNEGGWITILVTGLLVVVAIIIKKHYKKMLGLLRHLNNLMSVANASIADYQNKKPRGSEPQLDPAGKTAIILVSGYNGTGLHTLFNIFRLFGKIFKNYIFIQTGVIDAEIFKGAEEIEKLKRHVESEVNQYVNFIKSQGFYAEGLFSVGTDWIDEVSVIAHKLFKKYPNAVFFGGQLISSKDTLTMRILHNQAIFVIQRRLYQQGIPFLVMPIRVE